MLETAMHGSPVLIAVMLKQGLHAGIGESKLRWESPKVQRTVSGGRVERRRMRIKQGSKMRVEVSIVDLSRDRLNLVKVATTAGVKRERADESKVTYTLPSSFLSWSFLWWM